MAPLHHIGMFARDTECTSIQCVSAGGQVGVSLCIIFVVCGGGLVVYFSYFRGRSNADTDKKEDENAVELVTKNDLAHGDSHTHSDLSITVGGTNIVIRRNSRRSSVLVVEPDSDSAVSPSTSRVSDNTSNKLAVQSERPSARFRLSTRTESPPPPHCNHHCHTDCHRPFTILASAQDSSIPGPPSALPTPTSTCPCTSQYLELPPTHDEQLYSPVPSPGYATTVLSDSGSERGHSSPPVDRPQPKDSRSAARGRSSHPPARYGGDKSAVRTGVRGRSSGPTLAPHSRRESRRFPSATTLDTEARACLGTLNAMRVVSDSITDEDMHLLAKRMAHGPLMRVPSGATDATESTQLICRVISNSLSSEYDPPSKNKGPSTPVRRHRNVFSVHQSGDESRVGRPADQPCSTGSAWIRRDPHDLGVLGESRVGREQREVLRARASSSRPAIGPRTPSTDPRGRRPTSDGRRDEPRSKSVVCHFYSPFDDSRVTTTYVSPRRRSQTRQPHRHQSQTREPRSERRKESRVRRIESSERMSSSQLSETSYTGGSIQDSRGRHRDRDRDDRRHPPRTRSVLDRLFQVGGSRWEHEESRHRERSSRRKETQRETPAQRRVTVQPPTPSRSGTSSRGETPGSRNSPPPSFQRRSCRPQALPVAGGHQRSQAPSSAESRASTTGAICSFDGSNQATTSNDSQPAFPKGPAPPPTTVQKDTTDGNAT